MTRCVVPEDFSRHLSIPNARERFSEALDVSRRIDAAGIELLPNLDHAAIFTDPPLLVAGPLKSLGYVSGWDARCYPSPVDGQDYINVSAKLPADSPLRAKGWPDYVAVVHPVDVDARDHMLNQGYGNPFVHHLTWGIVAPDRRGRDDLQYSLDLIAFMIDARDRIQAALHQQPGTLITALPEAVVSRPEAARFRTGDSQVEVMEGGGFLLQFFVLTGGRIELALRAGTRQTFNPKSVYKISKDEISAIQA
ncbi:MAG: hypothetical protein HY646_13280 [Acidobacteria bacterium]|nr:hypothetical protein [Acidobacteriota bacterium]